MLAYQRRLVQAQAGTPRRRTRANRRDVAPGSRVFAGQQKLHRDDHVAYLTLNNPAKHNAISLEMFDKIQQATRDLAVRSTGKRVFRELVRRKAAASGIDDPRMVAMLRFNDGDYAWVTEQVKSATDRHTGGRIVSMLEGGYALSALGRSAVQHVRVLAGLNA